MGFNSGLKGLRKKLLIKDYSQLLKRLSSTLRSFVAAVVGSQKWVGFS